MILLALDTSTPGGGIALVRDDRLVEARSGDPSRTHGERLPTEILELLRAQALRPADVDVWAVAAGPGSFTGLRVGIATVQGFALVHDRRVVAVPSLDALACAAGPEADGLPIAAWIDAARGEVFAALFSAAPGAAAADPDTGLVTLDAPSVGRPTDVLDRWISRVTGPLVFAGTGAVRYRAILAGHPRARTMGEPRRPVVAAIADIAAVRARAGRLVGPHAIVPVYVRRSDAELARDRRASESA